MTPLRWLTALRARAISHPQARLTHPAFDRLAGLEERALQVGEVVVLTVVVRHVVVGMLP